MKKNKYIFVFLMLLAISLAGGIFTGAYIHLDEERQVSAGEVADLLKEMEENQVSLVLAEELYGKDMGETVKQETGCQICYLDTLVRGDYDPDSYLEAMQKNIDFMRQALEEEISSGIPERFQRLKSSL